MKSSIVPRKTRKTNNYAAGMDLAPDGLRMIFDWKTFDPGCSVFVPCIDMVEAVSQFHEIAQHRKWTYEHRCRVENKLQGVRFWRIS
jgi:hypothetical protein